MAKDEEAKNSVGGVAGPPRFGLGTGVYTREIPEYCYPYLKEKGSLGKIGGDRRRRYGMEPHVYIVRDNLFCTRGKPWYHVQATSEHHDRRVKGGKTYVEAVYACLSRHAVVVSCEPLQGRSMQDISAGLDALLPKEDRYYVCESDEKMRAALETVLGRPLEPMPTRPFLEEWKKIPGFEEYEVSNLGQVRKGCLKLMTPYYDGGWRVRLLSSKGSRPVLLLAKLVLQAFEPRYQGEKVLFKDKNRKNVQLSNLTWVGRDHPEPRRFLGVRCPQCMRALDWKHLYQQGPMCPCGVAPLQLCHEVHQEFAEENCTYFIVEQGKVMYVGTTNTLPRRVQEHLGTGNLKHVEDLRISLILGEPAMQSIYKPPRNKQMVNPNTVGDITRLKKEGVWVTYLGEVPSRVDPPKIYTSAPDSYVPELGVLFSKAPKQLTTPRSYCYGRGSTQFIGGTLMFRHKVWPCRCDKDCVTQLHWMRCLGKEKEWKEAKYKEGAAWWQNKMQLTEEEAWTLYMAM